MKKNKMMRAASALMVATLLTTSVISGTFAKYTTSANTQDGAHVAVWGFKPTTINISDLFKNAYDSTVKSGDEYQCDVIAPGTTGSAKFGFTYGGSVNAPEVAYTFSVDTEGSLCADYIKTNPNILWQLDNGDWGTWEDLLSSIKRLSGNASGTKEYAPGVLPEAFNQAEENLHTVAWKWKFETQDDSTTTSQDEMSIQDGKDTALGNDPTAAVNLKITITATQKV